MRICVFEADGKHHIGVVVDGRLYSLVEAFTNKGIPLPATGEALLSDPDATRLAQSALNSGHIAAPSFALDAVRVRPPSRPSKIVAVGLNYRQHVAESGLKMPKEPVIFAKFPSSISGPFDPIIIPRENPNVDWEVEFAVVIGRRGKRIPLSNAMEYVAGYVVLNDVSARAFQFQDKQWTRAKSCDTFTPFGPFLVTPDEIPDPHALRVTSRVNGQTMQDDNTSNLIFRVPELISFISATITLEPGDVIATGTPDGVGAFRNPPIYLKPGDVVEVEVEGIGTLRNPVVAEL